MNLEKKKERLNTNTKKKKTQQTRCAHNFLIVFDSIENIVSCGSISFITIFQVLEIIVSTWVIIKPNRKTTANERKYTSK